MYPTDRRYTKEHEWILVDGDTGTIGITDYAQDQLGDIVYVELPEAGRKVDREEVMGTIESVKAVSEVFAPLSGKLLRINETLEEQPELINDDCYDKGWLVAITPEDPGQLDALLDHEAYRALCQEQTS